MGGERGLREARVTKAMPNKQPPQAFFSVRGVDSINIRLGLGLLFYPHLFFSLFVLALLRASNAASGSETNPPCSFIRSHSHTVVATAPETARLRSGPDWGGFDEGPWSEKDSISTSLHLIVCLCVSACVWCGKPIRVHVLLSFH